MKLTNTPLRRGVFVYNFPVNNQSIFHFIPNVCPIPETACFILMQETHHQGLLNFSSKTGNATNAFGKMSHMTKIT